MAMGCLGVPGGCKETLFTIEMELTALNLSVKIRVSVRVELG